MATVTAPVHRLSVANVYRMVEAGVLDEHDRVEFVEGVLVDMVPIGAEQDGATAWLTRNFARVATDAWGGPRPERAARRGRLSAARPHTRRTAAAQ